jgi:hypoxanthine phosphoribosyltransferase
MVDDDIVSTRANADCLFSVADIERSMDRMASAITERLQHRNPLLLAVMNGGIVPAAMLLCRLAFPLQVDYIHLTRYGNKTTGGELEWIRPPPPTLNGRTVLVIDDLLDQGVTLQAAVDRCQANGAHEVLTAVLLVKSIPERIGLRETDFFGISTPDRYVFGFGMDYKTYWRNCPGIFAVKE